MVLSRKSMCRWWNSISVEAIFSSISRSMEGMSSSGMIHPRCLLRMLFSHVLAGDEVGMGFRRLKGLVRLSQPTSVRSVAFTSG